MKKLIIIVASVLCFCCVVGLGVGIYMNSPKVVARRAISGMIDDLGERDEIEPLIETFTNGSLEFSASADGDKLGTIPGFKGSLSGKLYFEKDEFYAEALNLSVNYPDEDVLIALKANAYVSDDYAYVTNQEILGGTYGIIRGEMEDAFRGSYFAGLLGKDASKIVCHMLRIYDDKVDEDIRKDLEDVLEKYLKLAYKSFCEHAEFESEKDRISLADGRAKCRVITITITPEDLYEVLEELYEELEDDDDLRDLVIEYGEYFEEIFEGTFGFDGDIDDMYDDLIEELGDVLEDLESDMDDDTDYIIEIATAKASKTVRKITFSIERDEIFSIDFGKDGPKKSDCIELTIEEDTVIAYTIEENSRKLYEAKLTYKHGKNKANKLFEIEIDKSNDRFEMQIGESISLKGDWITKSKSTTIELTKVKYGDQSFSKGFSFKLVLNERDKIPSTIAKKRVKNVFDLSESEVENIIRKAEDMFDF